MNRQQDRPRASRPRGVQRARPVRQIAPRRRRSPPPTRCRPPSDTRCRGSTGTVSPVPCSASMTSPHGSPPPTSSTSFSRRLIPRRREVRAAARRDSGNGRTASVRHLAPPPTTHWRERNETRQRPLVPTRELATLAGTACARPPKSRTLEGSEPPVEVEAVVMSAKKAMNAVESRGLDHSGSHGGAHRWKSSIIRAASQSENRR